MIAYTDRIMAADELLPNTIKARRLERKWSQLELAERAGISRAAVSGIEGQRLVPSVATALGLARVFECQVEDLFGGGANPRHELTWAWDPPTLPWRFWQAEVGGQVRLFPVDRTGETTLLHDGVYGRRDDLVADSSLARQTLVMAGCDPAVAVLATEYQRRSGMRLLALSRSSRSSLELLKRQLVHVAGIHFSTPEDHEGNVRLVREVLGEEYCLVRGATWQAGIVVSSGVKAGSITSLIRSKVRWVGREVGSGARHCLDQLLKPEHHYLALAADHRGVSEAVRAGWADAGVCLRLVGEEAGLQFLPVQSETYDLCFPSSLQHDPRIQSLVTLLQSPAYHKVLSDLPGYDVKLVGEIQTV